MIELLIFLHILSVIVLKVEGNVHVQNFTSLEMMEHNNTTLHLSVFQLPFANFLTENHTICYHSLSLEMMAKFSLILCKQFGFQALQRINSLDKKSFQNYLGKSVAINVTCNGNETLIEDCVWKSHRISSCNEFLGIECTRCNHSVTLEVGVQNIFELPMSVACRPTQNCEWRILKKSRKKGTIIKFQRVKPSFSQENILQTSGKMLEIKWMNNKTDGHIVKLGNEITSGNIVSITIPSDSMSLLYIPKHVCNHIVMDKITAVIYEEDAPKAYSYGSSSSQILILSSISFLIVLSVGVTFLCCERQKRKKHFYSQYNIHASWNCSWFSHYADSTSSQNSKTKREMTYFTRFPSISVDTAISEKDINCLITENETNCTMPVESNISSSSIQNKPTISHENQGVFDFMTDDLADSQTGKVTYKWKKGNFFFLLRQRFLPCFDSNSPRLCRNLVHPKPLSSIQRQANTELEDSSLESIYHKFNNSVLKLQWSDRSSVSVSERSLNSDADEKTILGLGNKYSDQYINGDYSWKTHKEVKETNSLPEFCNYDSDGTSVHSFKSLDSSETFYTAWHHSRQSIAFSDSDTVGTPSFECSSPISGVCDSSTDTVV